MPSPYATKVHCIYPLPLSLSYAPNMFGRRSISRRARFTPRIGRSSEQRLGRTCQGLTWSRSARHESPKFESAETLARPHLCSHFVQRHTVLCSPVKVSGPRPYRPIVRGSADELILFQVQAQGIGNLAAHRRSAGQARDRSEEREPENREDGSSDSETLSADSSSGDSESRSDSDVDWNERVATRRRKRHPSALKARKTSQNWQPRDFTCTLEIFGDCSICGTDSEKTLWSQVANAPLALFELCSPLPSSALSTQGRLLEDVFVVNPCKDKEHLICVSCLRRMLLNPDNPPINRRKAALTCLSTIGTCPGVYGDPACFRWILDPTELSYVTGLYVIGSLGTRSSSARWHT